MVQRSEPQQASESRLEFEVLELRAEPSLGAEVPEDADACLPADLRQHLVYIRIPEVDGEPSMVDRNVKVTFSMPKRSPLWLRRLPLAPVPQPKDEDEKKAGADG
jgi:hypothetical protein